MLFMKVQMFDVPLMDQSGHIGEVKDGILCVTEVSSVSYRSENLCRVNTKSGDSLYVKLSVDEFMDKLQRATVEHATRVQNLQRQIQTGGNIVIPF